jgi:ABC-2 type transport system permease protein
MTALQAEWIKLRSVRSTTWMLLALVGLTVALGVVSSSTSHTEGGPGGDEDVVMLSLVGVYFAQIAVVAFGVLAICSEYATGTIRTTFAANPRRREVLAAKTAIVGALVLAAAAVAAVASFYIGQAILRTNGYTPENGYTFSLGDADTLRKLAVAAAYPVILAVLSLSLAAILRNTATAITVLLGLLFVPWIVGGLLPEKLAHTIEEASPMVGIAAQEQGAPIAPWTGFAVTVAWAAGALVVALWLVARRDA